MYVSEAMVQEMVARYGEPAHREFRFAVSEREYNRITSSQRKGRKHDFTVYITKGDKLVVTAKHPYPPGLCRSMSGGLDPGEDFHTGIYREVFEETGCEIAIERFVLRTNVTFFFGDKEIPWQSFVFLSRYVSGDFNFTDTHEIREVALADWSDFEQYGEIMRASDSGGLHYRAALHEAVVEVLNAPQG